MKNELLVSVFMITYNHEQYIRKAIDGVLNQKTNFRYELVIGEDSSNDRTREICEEYANRNTLINLLPKNNINLGVSKNALRVFNACKGKYIAICEGDDYWTDPYKLQKQVDFLEKNQEFVLSHHNAETINSKGEFVNESNLNPAHARDLSQEDLLGGIVISTLTMCFRNVIKKFPEEFLKVPIADMFLLSLLGKYGKGKYQPEITPAKYRVHSGGVWSSLSLQKKTKAKVMTWFYMAQYYNRIGNKKLSNYFYRKASFSSPALIKLSIQNRDLKEAFQSSSRLVDLKLKQLRNKMFAE